MRAKTLTAIIMGYTLVVGCAGIQQRRAVRQEAEQTLHAAEFEVNAAAASEASRYSPTTIADAQRSLQRAKADFDGKKYAEASSWARSARENAALAVRQSKEAKDKEAKATAQKIKDAMPVKKAVKRPKK